MEGCKLVIQYNWGLGKRRKEIMHSELQNFLNQNAIAECNYEVIEIHKPCGEVIR
ncbi:hypothetical protein [Cytobacillus depressus]|uniref:hypothetical protein n=1 Tax=Cytobacillus depressus TaxID=1602942 RepID=UPI001478A7E6|nr:hypothetical protein [Cytobacillus depressus]